MRRVVYAKRPFGGAEHLFEYLGRYTHRVAISNHRLRSLSQDHVSFRTKGDKTVRLHALEFIRRFLLHVLPSGFVKIRHYGLYASSNVKTRLQHARELLVGDIALPLNPVVPVDVGGDADWQDLFLALTGINLKRCPRCPIGLLQPQPIDWTPTSEAEPDPAPPPQ
jgi:hypothetical protein